jgi:hypothetical protein
MEKKIHNGLYATYAFINMRNEAISGQQTRRRDDDVDGVRLRLSTAASNRPIVHPHGDI